MVRLAKESDFPKIFAIRKQVHELHLAGRPDIYRMPEDIDEFAVELQVWAFNQEAVSFYESLGACVKNQNMEILL